MKFYVLGDESTVTGFKLVGVEGEAVETVDEAREALSKALSMPEIGIIIVTERFAEGLREEVRERVFGSGFPLVIEIPDRNGPLPGRVSIRQIVRSAVGIGI